jgi:hypothetical protein
VSKLESRHTYTEAIAYIPTQFPKSIPKSIPKSLQSSFLNSFGGDERVGVIYESMCGWMGVDLWIGYERYMAVYGNVEKTRGVYGRGSRRRVDGLS